MNDLLPDAPIGVFDSGVGGLTVAHAVARRLPHEHLLYFGDTAHLPYGDKSTAAIQAYSVKICDWMLGRGAKVILIACNSASASAYELVREYVGQRALVVNVIDPAVAHVAEHHAGRTIGLIGTRRTVHSGVYRKKIQALGLSITLKSLATPLLVPMIEEGFLRNKLSRYVISEYLNNKQLDGVTALLLGCTHFPLIKEEVVDYYAAQEPPRVVSVIDSSEIVAAAVHDQLAARGLLRTAGEGEKHFYVSDYTPSFEASTRLFFGRQVRLEVYPMWE
ncbi:MAG: glutamate racemase [Catalinimonas sp.]